MDACSSAWSGERGDVSALRLLVDNEPSLLKLTRKQKSSMLKPSDGWKIDGWPGNLKAGYPRAAK